LSNGDTNPDPTLSNMIILRPNLTLTNHHSANFIRKRLA